MRSNSQCCLNCPDRLVTEDCNCHDHCKTYLESFGRDEQRDFQKAVDSGIYGQQTRSVQRAKKKWRHRNG